MSAQTDFITFTGKSEPVDVDIGTGPGIKTEHLEDSPCSSVEAAASSAATLERDCGSPGQGDGATDLSGVDESPAQPILRSFPVSVIAGKARRFTAHWYSKYGAWLEYSAEKDAIFCKVCRHFGNNLIADKFTRGFRNWKRTHQACSKHELSKAHNTALCKFLQYKEQSNHVTFQVDHHYHHDVATPGLIQSNRDHIKVVLDVVMFCVRQHVSLCKHKEHDPGNFRELFQLLCDYDPRMKSRFDAVPGSKDSTPTGPEIRNDLIDAAASLLLRQIKQELHNSCSDQTHYAVLTHECSDQSERRLVAVCLRYLHGGSIKERVVGFVDVSDTQSVEGIALKILQILEPFELDPGLCVGFGFDGASVMSGVDGILKRTFPRAMYVHCRSHRLNSVLCDASKGCPEFKTFFETVNALHLFLAHGSRASRFLEIQKEMHPDWPPLEYDAGLGSATDVLCSFDVVLEMLTEFAESGGLAGLEAQSLLQQVQTKKFSFLLAASCKLLEVSQRASELLQIETSSLTESIDSIERLKQSLYDLRHEGFDRISTASNELASKNDIVNWDVSFSRKRKLPNRDDSTSLCRSARVSCAEDLRALWDQILGLQINELDSRFHPDAYGIMKAADALRNHDTKNLSEIIRPVCRSYGVNVSDDEISAFSQTFRRTSSAGSCFSLIEVYDACGEESFPNLHLLIRILLTLPITTCTDGRICSSVNKIKTASRGPGKA
ncbi:zinc finger MYM-type protein 1-like [Clarias magur]|uniref:Zinc finger MYM-type protein 1-like n=1 Tax=Clarias magur TaxID=1594786 RepID=A0A8J4TY50_CLAMG|nr:zinc finger MYM-type protein 1-like [Clarias magur]